MDGIITSLAAIVENQGWLAFPISFLGGVISSTSPCVLAMVPLVMGYVGGYAGSSQRKAVKYSLSFTLGLTVTFTVLGVVAGAMGRLFGDIGDFWKYILPPVAILVGLQLLGVFEFNFGVSQKLLPKKKALLGAFLMGLLFGVVATPCATPVLAAIMTLAVSKSDIVLSGALLLAYALGHWLLIFGAGVSASFAQRVIQNRGINNFTTYARKAAGVVLIGVGIYFAVTLFI